MKIKSIILFKIGMIYISNLHAITPIKIKMFQKPNYNVLPSGIESILHEHPDIKECIVFGKKDPTIQELISVVIVPADNKEVCVIDQFLMIIKCIKFLGYRYLLL